MMTAADISRLFQPIRLRLANLISRAYVSLVDNTKKTQRVQIGFGMNEVLDGIERIQEYGLDTHPPVAQSSEAMLLSAGGMREASVVIAVAAREYRPNPVLAEGEVCLYSKFGQKVTLKADGSIEIDSVDKPINVTCGDATITASGAVNVDAGGDVTVDAGTNDVTLVGGTINLKGTSGNAVMVDTIISKLNGHQHTVTVDGVSHSGTTATMTAGGTTLTSAADSAEHVLALKG